MPIRTTPLAMYTRSLYDIQSSYSRLVKAQIDISSGRRLHVVSDDPADASRALSTRNSLLKTIQARESITAARFATQKQSEVLESISSAIASARVTAEAAANGINSKIELKTLSLQLDSILAEIVGQANTQLDGRYLFSGSKVHTPPILTTKSNGTITGVSYGGDDLTRMVRIGPFDTRPIDVSGLEAFFTPDRGPTAISGPSALAATVGAHDTMTGSAKLIVAHTATTLGDGALGVGGDTASGLQPGLSSSSDTIVGNHTITVTSDPLNGENLVSLDGGVPVPFDGTETDLQLEAPGGAVAHVDVTAFAPGFTGDVAVVGDGTVAVEGQPPQALTFQGDFVLDDGNGRVVHLDTSAIERDGENLVVFPGTESIFDVLIALRDDINSAGGFPPQGLADRIQARVASLDRGHDTLLGALAEVGSRGSTFGHLADSLSLFEVSLEETLGNLEGTDIFAASTEVSEAEAAYQAALAVAGKVSNLPSLLNFI